MYCDLKEIVTESFAVTDMTAITSAVLFLSESKGSGFHANERPYTQSTPGVKRARCKRYFYITNRNKRSMLLPTDHFVIEECKLCNKEWISTFSDGLVAYGLCELIADFTN